MQHKVGVPGEAGQPAVAPVKVVLDRESGDVRTATTALVKDSRWNSAIPTYLVAHKVSQLSNYSVQPLYLTTRILVT